MLSHTTVCYFIKNTCRTWGLSHAICSCTYFDKKVETLVRGAITCNLCFITQICKNLYLTPSHTFFCYFNNKNDCPVLRSDDYYVRAQSSDFEIDKLFDRELVFYIFRSSIHYKLWYLNIVLYNFNIRICFICFNKWKTKT